jgi:hypothetical protein
MFDDPKLYRVDRDFVFVMSAYDIDPGTYLPKVSEMTAFNMWTWNGLFKYKITHANDGTVPTLNEIGRRFLSRALPALLRKRRPEE